MYLDDKKYEDKLKYSDKYTGGQLDFEAKSPAAVKMNEFRDNQNKAKGVTYKVPNMGPAIAKNDSFNIRHGNYVFDPNIDYMAKMIEAERAGDYNAAQYWENMRNAKIAAGFGGIYQPTSYYNYASKYDDKIADLRDQIENYKDFSYDVESDENYKNLANIYHKNALAAQKNALAQAAAANGGRLSSNAIIAASLGYSNKMSELEGEIPELRRAAYNMYLNDKADLRNVLNDYMNAEAQDYGRWSDDFNRRFSISRAKIGDDQWSKQFEQSERTLNAQLDSNKVNEAYQRAVLLGYVAPEDAELLGVPAGTPTQEAIAHKDSLTYNYANLTGVVPDKVADEYGVRSGIDTLAKQQLNETTRHNQVYEAINAAENQGYDYGDDYGNNQWGDGGGNEAEEEIKKYIEGLTDGQDPFDEAKMKEFAEKYGLTVDEVEDMINGAVIG